MEIKRISRQQLYMGIAQLLAKRGTCDRATVGALIVRDDRIVSTGYNGAPPGMGHCHELGCLPGPDGSCLRTTHAEANAIAFAARHGISTEGCVMYTTMVPCLSCAKLILSAGIEGIFYLKDYKDTAGSELLLKSGIVLRQVDFNMSLVEDEIFG